MDIQETYKAVQLQEYNKPAIITQLPIPKLEEGQVLIKVEAAPINPSDLKLLLGHFPYNSKILPAIPGNEGSGVIAQLGLGVPEYLQVGSRVAFFARTNYGSYAQYSVAHFSSILKLDDDVTLIQAASSFINPVTVIGMLELAQQHKSETVVQNAGASALGRMLFRYFQQHNIKVINVVRRQEQVDILKSEGAEFILNQSDPNFEKQLQELSLQHKANLLFDPVGGEAPGQLLTLLPNDSTAVVYGSLAGTFDVNFSLKDLIYKNKSIRGFWLVTWLREKGNDLLVQPIFQAKLNGLLKSSLKTVYVKEFNLDQFHEATEFAEKNASLGKILIRPN